ncbi:MAG: peptidase S8, partial [Candidatus Nitrosothermus koennekii]
VFVGYGFTKDQPRFGNSNAYYNDIAEFSSRGPLANGYPKPEILATGAYAFVPMLVNVKHANSEPVWLFGGTSMAGPIVSGASAIIIQALREKGVEPDPQLVKNILLASAKDINNEPFAQGHGVLDLTNALRYINNEEGSFIVYTNNTKEILDIIGYDKYNPKGLSYNLSSGLAASSWYAGFMENDKEAKFYIHNPSDSVLHVKIKPNKLELIDRLEINGTTEVRKIDPILNRTDAFAPNYIRLNKTDIPKGTELLVAKLRFPFETFMNMSDIYAHNLRISSLYLYEWNDANNDDKIWYNETRLVNRGGAYGTIQDLSVYDPLNRIKDDIVIGVY